MSKTSGLGDNFYIGGYDLSGDLASLEQIGGGPNLGDVTGISESAHERIGLIRDGRMQFTSYMNNAAGQEHAILSTLPTADTIGTYFRGSALSGAAACINCVQANYDPTRDNQGGLTWKVDLLSDQFGLEWGIQHTAGLRTDTAATNGTTIDNLASSALGGQAYLQVLTFSGTDVTIKLRHSTDDTTYADLFNFTQITTARHSQRLAVTSTVNRYTRVETSTSAGFTSVVFAVMFKRNAVAVSF